MIQKIAFAFPGQGSQSVGMLKNIAPLHPIIQETFQEASDTLGYDLWKLSEQGPIEQLNQTEFTQPALLTASVALWRLWLLENNPLPEMAAGHSLGEYSALVCANALSLSEGVNLVSIRGRLMQAAVPEGKGAMAAILGLDDATVNAICQEESRDNDSVAAANYNAVGQVVISGNTLAVLRAMEKAKAQGAKRTIQLPVSVPSHCELMQPAAILLKETLNSISFKLPTFPVIHNVDVKVHFTIEEIKQALIDQVFKPVRWVETIQYMAQHGVTHIRECGPGSVLSSLSKRINMTLQYQSLSNREVLCP